MADDIKSLAARIQKLETSVKGSDKSLEELERKGKYLDGILNDINRLKDQMSAAEKHIDDTHKKLVALEIKAAQAAAN